MFALGIAISAGAGVNQFAMPCFWQASSRQFPLDIFARTTAGVSQPGTSQLIQGTLVKGRSLRLELNRFIRVKPEGSQLPKNDLCHARQASWRINILNANQPLAVVGFGIQPAGQGRNE